MLKRRAIMEPLPIDNLVPRVVTTLRDTANLVIEAPPGAGKTTRVPVALIDTVPGRQVVVIEPRRLAARLAARRVASERDERVGEQVGYAVRFETVVSARTRVVYMTEGVLLRRLLEDRALARVGVVVLDEFHERHLASDLLLALLRRLKETARPDLRLVVMSATLDAEPVARYLDACPRLVSEGSRYDVAVDYLSTPDQRPLATQIVSAVRRALREAPPGDLLVFLPGAAEIRRASDALAETAEAHDLEVRPLHGDLPIEEQALAIRPSLRRKVILSTNVAESSVTIQGITVVIDAGLARVSRSSAWTGLPQLTSEPISRASAKQRAGRAGRLRSGIAYRLYTRGDLERRPEHDAPEIIRSDLTEAWLLLHGVGVARPDELHWLTPPPAAAQSAAEQLLAGLGALGPARALTELGRRMLELPVHPRLARVLVEGERRGIGDDAALAAALLSERDIRRGARTWFGKDGGGRSDGRGANDIEELAEQWHTARDLPPHQVRALGLDPGAVKAVERSADHLQRALEPGAMRPSSPEDREAALCLALLTGFPDRVARRREPLQSDLILCNGERARLSPLSVVHDASFLVALDAEEARQGKGSPAVVHLASRVDPDWLLELHPDRVQDQDELVWNADAERVERVRRLTYGSVALDELRQPASPSAQAATILAREARAAGWEQAEFDRLAARVALVRDHFPELGLPELTAEVTADLLAQACSGATSFAELRHCSLVDRFLAGLSARQGQALRELTPELVTLRGGRQLRVAYERGKLPWVASRLQDFFGSAEGPRILEGRVLVTLHLLAPNQRAVQVTTDLAGFWERHYPAIRRQLIHRYPKHDWPEQGSTAVPPPPGRIRAPR